MIISKILSSRKELKVAVMVSDMSGVNIDAPATSLTRLEAGPQDQRTIVNLLAGQVGFASGIVLNKADFTPAAP